MCACVCVCVCARVLLHKTFLLCCEYQCVCEKEREQEIRSMNVVKHNVCIHMHTLDRFYVTDTESIYT